MTETCPVCDDDFEASADGSATRVVAEHLVERSRDDARHRTWVDENTKLGNVSEITERLEG